MNYDNYIELYEAIYFFDRIIKSSAYKIWEPLSYEYCIGTGITNSAYEAMLKILYINDLIHFDGDDFVLTNETAENLNHIIENIIKKDPNKQFTEFFNKATSDDQFFFHNISDYEYEIYSRYNFAHTYGTGKYLKEHIDFSNTKILELGGNSGGLGTSIVEDNLCCDYTVLDTKIPCRIGTEYMELNGVNMTFVEGDIFNLELDKEPYDYIVIMNILHDFDDERCSDILMNCKDYSNINTKFIIIEDVLSSYFEPKALIMHGLRLSVECRGGKQRTAHEIQSLFESIDFKIEKEIKLNYIHTMLVFGMN